MKHVLLAALLACACGGDDAPGDPDSGPDAAAAPDAAPAPDAPNAAAACPDGEVAVSIANSGALTCAAVDGAAAIAVRSRCSVYLGQRDECDGCDEPPAKWGATSTLACSRGEGNGNACVSAILDDPAAPVALAALDLDGDVNGDDKLYTTLHCVAAPQAPRPAPCAPGWAIAGRAGGTWMCAPLAEAAVDYVGTHCAVYLGWQDSCDGCSSAPAKWGFAGDAGCAVGAGDDSDCVTATLAGETLNLFGLNTDGDIDGNDKLHIGLRCDSPSGETSTSSAMCPDRQFVVATGDDGTFTCAPPAPAVAEYVAGQCTLFFGWRDSCDACTEPPLKWGSAGIDACANGAGADNTCTTAALGKDVVELFGLNTDGDVNSDDTLYVGLRCRP